MLCSVAHDWCCLTLIHNSNFGDFFGYSLRGKTLASHGYKAFCVERQKVDHFTSTCRYRAGWSQRGGGCLSDRTLEDDVSIFYQLFFFCVVTVLNIPTWFLFLSFVTHDLCVCVCMWSVVWNADGTKPRFTYRVWRTRHCCIFLVICSVPFGRYGFCKGRLGSPLGEKPSFIVCAYAKSVFVFTRPWWCGRGVVVWLAY